MNLVATHSLDVTSTPAALPVCGSVPAAFVILLRNTGENALTFAPGADAPGFSVPAGAAVRLPTDRPEGVFLASASGTTADVAYFV